jgi:hypothetical protein
MVAAVMPFEPQVILGLDVAVSARVRAIWAQSGDGNVAVDHLQTLSNAEALGKHPTCHVLGSLWRLDAFPEVAQVSISPGEDHVVAVPVLVGEKKPDEVWVTFVSAAESLQNFDLSLVFFSLFSMKCFDGKVLFIGALSIWNMLAIVICHDF